MNNNIGSSFDDFLADEGIKQETTAIALKRVLAWQLAEAMKEQNITKTAMASQMQASRATLDRLLDSNETSLTLNTLVNAVNVLGKDIQINLVDRPIASA